MADADRFVLLLVVLLLNSYSSPLVESSCPAFKHTSTTDAKVGDVKRLRGKWRVEHFSTCDGHTGKVMDFSGKVNFTLVFPADDMIRIDAEGVKYLEWEVKYDHKKTPVWIDVISRFPHDDKEKKAKIGKGVLMIDGDNLTIHLGFGVRPGDFDHKKNLTSMLFKCKKVK